MANDNFVDPPPFFPTNDPSSDTLALVNLEEDMNMFLRDMDTACASRGKLSGHSQLDCFLAILVFSVVKSMLIDAYSFRDKYEDLTEWRSTDAAKITSAFKTLVSVFCWSSRTDVVLQPLDDIHSVSLQQAIRVTRALVHQDQWDSRGIKGTKEFLLGLGSFSTLDTRYNGFLPQRFGSTPSSFSTHLRARENSVNLAARPNKQIFTGNVGSGSSLTPQTPVGVGLPARTALPDLEQIRRHPGSARSLSSPTPSTESLTFANETVDTSSSGRKHGGRKGALDAETSKRAREMRKLGSCWNCCMSYVFKFPW